MQALKVSRHHRTTNAQHLIALKDLGFDTTNVAEAFGVTPNSVSSWIRDNMAPYWTKIASEALESRHKSRDINVVILMVPSKYLATIKSLANGLGIKSYHID